MVVHKVSKDQGLRTTGGAIDSDLLQMFEWFAI